MPDKPARAIRQAEIRAELAKTRRAILAATTWAQVVLECSEPEDPVRALSTFTPAEQRAILALVDAADRSDHPEGSDHPRDAEEAHDA